MPRLFIDQPLHADQTLALPPGPSRHVQVLRLQPGAELTLFNGQGGEWSARVLCIGRSEVEVRLGRHHAIERELACSVTLAVGMPANERMDGLVEKATELGVAAIQPLLCERSVLRLSGERAHKKVEHWRGVAAAASEQSGRTRVPHIAEVMPLAAWLAAPGPDGAQRCVLSLGEVPTLVPTSSRQAWIFLSGPEGGLSPHEEAAAAGAGFDAVSLGPRVLRADTAPLAALAIVGSAFSVNRL